MAVPPFPAPAQVQILGVLPGETGLSFGGGVPGVPGPAIALIDGDPNGFFSVRGLVAYTFEVDPEFPTLKGHKPQRTWVPVDFGPGVFIQNESDGVLVYVDFRCPAFPTQEVFSATALVVADDSGSTLLQIPIEARVGSVVSLRISPDRATVGTPGSVVLQNNTQQFNAIGVVSDGTVRDLTASVRWSSKFPEIATVSSQGLATGKTTGTTIIGADFKNLHAAALLTVV